MTSADYLKSKGKAHNQPIPHDVKKSVAYMREATDRNVSMADLVAYCGVAERTLHKHFRAFMAVSPLEYWRRLRLSAAREELLKGASNTSISEVATRFGFNHFGRFSQQYRRSFGETPSATLRRSRVVGGPRTGSTRDFCIKDVGIISSAPLMSRERPSVAVLRCQVSAAEPQYRYFGECVAEGMAIALGRARSLSVVVPAARPLDPQRAAQEAGAKYALIGTIAQTGERVRIIVRLLDASTGSHVWGDCYDGVVGDLLGLQDQVTEGVKWAVLPHIRGAEIERVQRKPPSDLDAYGLTMGAFPFVLAFSHAKQFEGEAR